MNRTFFKDHLMSKTPFITTPEIKLNIEKLQKFMKDQALDGFYISSYDEFLNEYVPQEDCHRIYITGFTGSTAEVLFLANSKPKLYVDGRYHEQADQEVDASLVDVVKCTPDKSLHGQLVEDIKSLKLSKIGFEADRTSLSFLKTLDESSVN